MVRAKPSPNAFIRDRINWDVPRMWGNWTRENWLKQHLQETPDDDVRPMRG